MHTIEKFTSTFPDISVIVVLAKQLNDDWKSLCTKHNFTIQHQLIDGGETRHHSVKNGLSLVPDNTSKSAAFAAFCCFTKASRSLLF